MKSWFKRAATTPRAARRRWQPAATTPMMLALEPRIMFDGAVVATIADIAVDHPAATTDHQGAAADDADASGTAVAPTGATDQRHEIVFIESSVANYQQLVDAANPGSEVVVLDASTDGLQQIADYLAGREQIDAIHILSHGQQGEITLGTLQVNQVALEQNAATLARIGAALSESGDILLYGCRVGGGEAGSGFITQLASLTQSDVAASTDDTGSAAMGGDWLLEYRAGSIEAEASLDHEALATYDGLLVLPASTQQFSDTYWNNNTGGNTVNGFSLAESTGAIRQSSANSIYFSTAFVKDDPGVAGDYYADLTWTADNVDLARFDLDGMAIQVFGGNYRLDFSATSGGSPVSETFTYSGAQGPLVVNLNAALFNDIDAFTVRITNLSGAATLSNMDLQQLILADLQAPNTTPVMANIDGDSAGWAGAGATVVLDNGGNASLTDAEFGALNGGNGNWSGGSLTVQRSGTSIAADVLGFSTSGALFSISGNNLQSAGQTFATFTNTSGVLTISYTSSATAATTALVNDVVRHINYRNDTPSGDAALRFTLSDGIASTTANVTVTSDSIYVTNPIDTATINAVGGVSFSEALAIAAADVTGSQTIVIDGSLAGQTVSTSAAGALGENLTLNIDPATGVILSGGTLSIGSGFSLIATNGTGDTATIATALSGAGGLTKAGAGSVTLSGVNTYTGATAVAAGTLTFSGGSALDNGNALAVLAGAGVTIANSEEIGSLTGAGTVTVAMSQTLTVGNVVSSSFSGSLTGAGVLTVSQSNGNTNTLTLTGNNSGLTGAVRVVNYGRLIADGDNAINDSAAVTVNSNGILTLLSNQTVGSLASNLASASIQLGSFTLTTGGNDTATTVYGEISGTGNLIKQGSATTTLAGLNTYSGTTSVSAGTLSIASDANLGSAAVLLAAGATLEVTSATNIDNAITLSGNATVSNSANVTLSGVISGTNHLTKSGASTLTLSNTNTYSATTVSAGTLSVASDSNLGSGTVTLAGGTTLAITGSTNIDNLIALTGNAAVGTTANATLSGVISGSSDLSKTGAATLTLSATNTYGGATTVTAGTLRLAADSNLGGGGLTLAAGTTLMLTGTTTIDNAVTVSGAATVNLSADATLSGNIDGAGSLTKTGANALTLSGSNSYAGTTTVAVGTLRVASDSNLGSSTITLATGTTLAITGTTDIDNAITLSSGNATVQTIGVVTLSGAVSGAGGLIKTGAGTLTLSGGNGFTGNVNLSAGGLTLSGGTAIDNSSAVTAGSGTTLALSSSETVGSFAGAGNVALGTNTLTTGGNNTSTSHSGSIGGAGGGITKTGSGTLTLSGTNSYTGNTTVSAGTLDAQNGEAIGNSSAVSIASGAFLVLSAAETIGSLAGAGSVSFAANTLTTGGNNSSTTFSGDLTGTGALVKNGSGALTLSNAGNSGSMSGGITVAAGTLAVASDNNLSSGSLTLASGSTLDVSGATNIDNAIILSGNATVSNSANATLSGIISGANNLTKAGAATLTLSNTNTYAGTTVGAGTLSIVSDGNLGSGFVTLADGTTLAVSGITTIDNTISLAGNATVGNSAAVTLAGDISGSGNLAKSGASALTLSGANAAHSGNYTVGAGTLSIGGDSNLGSGSVTLAAGTTLQVTSGGTIDNDLALAGSATLQVLSATTWSGVVSGSNNLAKTGASLLTLANTNVLTGIITVSTGTLAVTGTASAITVASGATLTGTGTVDGTVAVQNGGTLSPGSSPGTLTINGDLAMVAGSTLVVEINGTTAGIDYDQIIVNGTVDVSSATLSVTHGYTPGSGDTYTFIVNDAADAVTGTFSGISEGSTLSAGGNGTILTASYIGGTGNDSTLTSPLMPTVTSITSVSADGTYHSGDVVTLAVNFSDVIFLSTGTIQLILETGATDRSIGYVSGSGSSTLYFSYTVQEGDTSSDLDYVSTAGLIANGDQVQSSSFVDAILTLATPGAAGSLGSNQAIVIDGVRPTSSVVVTDTDLSVGETSLVTITFSEAVTGFDSADLTIANGSVSVVGSSDGGITWTATLTPAASIADATNLITLTNAGVQDTAGNAGAGTTDSNNYAIDTVPPTATIVIADDALAAGETSSVTITFNEAVSGFSNADLTVANGTLSAVSSANGGVTWTTTLTPTAGIADPTNLITLANTGVMDAAGNAGAGSTDSNNYAIDTIPVDDGVPAVVSVAVPVNGNYVAGQHLDFTVTLSEAVVVDSAGGTPRIAVTLDNGDTAYANYLSGSGSNALIFRLTVVNGQLDTNGVSLGAAIDSNGATVRSAAGIDANVSLDQVGNTAGVRVDAVAPTASSLIRTGTSPENARELHYQLNFSEDVSGVDVSDLRLVTTGSVSATLAGVTQVDARTYDIAVNNVTGNGTLQVDVDSTGTDILDTAGNAMVSGLVGSAYTVTTVAPMILTARADDLPLPRPFSSIVIAPLSSSLPSIFDLQLGAFSSAGEGARSIHTVALAANERIDLTVPWRPENFANWSVVELRSSDGSEVPAWLHYDYTTGTLQGTPPAGFRGPLEIQLVVTDSHGQHVIGTVQLQFNDVAQRSDATPSLEPPAKPAAAKPGLDAQFARHARSAPLGVDMDVDAASLLRQLHGRTSDRQPIPNHARF